jgi:hypothetical protein
MNASSDTLIDTSRPFSSINAVIAEMTFFHHTLLRIELHHAKRTSLHTGLASITGLRIYKHDAIRPLLDRIDRAGLLTGRAGALETSDRIIDQSQFTVDPLNPLGFYLNPPRTLRRVVLLFAG